jgi:hypothetical protein
VERRDIAGNGLWDGGGCECGSLELLTRNGGSQTQLQLRLRGAEQRLVDLRLVRLEDDIRCGRVGVALKDYLLVGVYLEDAAKLYKDDMVSFKLILDLLIASLELGAMLTP